MESRIQIQIGIKTMPIHNIVPIKDANLLSFTISTEISALFSKGFLFTNTVVDPGWYIPDLNPAIPDPILWYVCNQSCWSESGAFLPQDSG